jgi:DNA polymerase III subunit delta'
MRRKKSTLFMSRLSMSLKDIFCQDRAIALLQRAYAADRCAHAYVFAGLDGVGKYTTAQQWAKLLLCKNPVHETRAGEPFADGCGHCESCTLIESNAHPDYVHVYKELLEFTKEGKGRAAPVELPIDVVREFLIAQVSSRPTLSARRVFVVSEAQKLNPNSQNALLKVLEEPPRYCTIILLCTRLEELLPTTKSRCQIVRFGPINEGVIEKVLSGRGLDSQKSRFLGRLAQGSLGQACEWATLDQAGASLFDIKRQVVLSLVQMQLANSLDMAEQFLAAAKTLAGVWGDLDKGVSKSDINRRASKAVLQIVVSVFYDAMMCQVDPQHALIHADQDKEIRQLAGRLDPEQAARMVELGAESLRWIEANVNEKLIFERLLLRTCRSAIIHA